MSSEHSKHAAGGVHCTAAYEVPGRQQTVLGNLCSVASSNQAATPKAPRQPVLGVKSPQRSPEEVLQDLLSALLNAAKGVRHIAHQVGVSAQFGQLLHDNHKGG